MRILLKLVLDCDVDAAWTAVRSPAVFQQVSAPIMRFTSLEPGGYPESWPEGEHPVAAKAFGLVPVGEQVIRIGIPPERAGARLVVDTGYGVSGIFTTVTAWHHTMAVSPLADGRTLYRDELRFEAGRVTALLWPVYWVFWQWRALRISQLARTWQA
ncbi:hypothetical protein [Marisediminicola sp. LYQ85]|uniref:hypothetical protein n=1 Tax=Marisediminicola sp. LYQ85 TaxID=3391062 RepID=UPI003983AEB0